ncbi:MAG: HAD family hydrolase [candidate division NC10 bacterium]|nr:HAD family hydrolase [candidate division NC10 bacterium]
MTSPKVLALDFDGVVCDTVREAGRSAWEVIRPLRGTNGGPLPAGAMAAFVRLRSAVEFGWEFPLILWSILDGVSEAALLAEFQGKWREVALESIGLTPEELGRRFDAARDGAIARSLEDWLMDQRLYPGMAARLTSALRQGIRIYILTTKGGRFAHRLLEVHDVPLPLDQVWGRERQHPKPALLRILRRLESAAFRDIWFVEDRLKTLQAVRREPDLGEVGLFLALWGYVRPGDPDEAGADPRISPLSLERFCGEFDGWRK